MKKRSIEISPLEQEQKNKNLVYSRWIKEVETPARQQLIDRYEMGRVEEDLEAQELNQSNPLISIVMPTYNTDPGHLHEAIQSVLKQCYPHWQLCVVDDASDRPWVTKIIRRYASQDSRISVTLLTKNGGIAKASNCGIEMSQGHYIGFLDHDDVITPHALIVMAAYCREHPQTTLIYSNSDELDGLGQRGNPFFKPEWNYELFLGQNYLNHFCLYKKTHLKKVQGLRSGFQGSQDFDLALRVIEGLPPKAIAHVPEILYHWRVVESSVSRSDLKKATENSRRALQQHLNRTGQQGEVGAAAEAIIYNRVKWQRKSSTSQVVVFVFGRNAVQIERVVSATKQLILTENYLVLPVLLELNKGECNTPKNLNRCVATVEAGVVCFLSEDYLPFDKESLQALLAQAERPSVGAVSGKLVTEGDSSGVDSSGVDSSGADIFTGNSSAGYFSHLVLDQQVDAIHGACFATQKRVFDAVGGLDETFGQKFDAKFDARFEPKLASKIDQQSPSLASMGRSYSQRVKALGLSSIWSAQAKVKLAAQAGNDLAANDCLAHWPEPVLIGEVQG